MNEYPHVAAYPDRERFEEWEQVRRRMGYESRSKWLCEMVEAGIEAYDASGEETIGEVKSDRAELRSELAAAEKRIQALEEETSPFIEEAVIRVVEEEPGRDAETLIEEIASRVISATISLEGQEIYRTESGEYHPVERDS